MTLNRIKPTIVSLLLAGALLSSCAPSSLQPSDSNTSTSTSTSTSENTTATNESTIDSWEAIQTSGEVWLSYGLLAYKNNQEPQNLKGFFSIPSNLAYLTLYDHFFTYDEEKSKLVAEALFRFILDEYGVEALLDIDKRCEYKDAYLKSLGLDIAYTNAKEVEAFLSSMDFTSNDQYKYIISFDKVTYCFKDFDQGSPAQYHGFLYHSTVGLYEMINYMKSNNLCEGLDTGRDFNYYMTFDGSGYSKTITATGDMYINDASATLHEAVHAMGVGIIGNENIWLSEGICNYFGRALGFNDQIAITFIQTLTMIEQGYFDEGAAAGDTRAMLYKEIAENYVCGGGKLDSVNTFNFRLYADVTAKVELELGAYQTLGDAYRIVNKAECNSVGHDLSYEQTTSLILYLVDTYGLNKVLEAYHTQDIESVFGKDYESLKVDWLTYLYK